jgi:hypothetical protein
VHSPQISVSDRVEMRRQMRNLDNFLQCDFNEPKKLSLIQSQVHGHAIEILKEINEQDLGWGEYSNLWWNDSSNLRKVSEYIVDTIPVWEEFLKKDEEKMVLLEKQCAHFERIVSDYNQSSQKSEKPEKPVAFVNPFKKILRIVSSHPLLLGHTLKTKTEQEIIYDRLTTEAELTARVEAAKNKPVLVQILGTASVEKSEKIAIPFTVIPKELFKTVSQDKQELFDPTDNKPREKEQVINITYDDPDFSSVYSMLFKAGETQTLTHVYEQGFIAGKISGHAEALQKIQQLFAEKASK